MLLMLGLHHHGIQHRDSLNLEAAAMRADLFVSEDECN
jgi:hypothetical protein